MTVRKDYIIVSLLMLFTSSFVFFSCTKDDVYPDDAPTVPYSLAVPKYFPEPVDMPDNRMTASGIKLGQYLFYEPLLSANRQVSCATCHQQDKAFADGLKLSNTGISGKPLERHSPVLFNLAWTDQGFFWDGGAKNLESQAFGPLTHADEMGIYFPEMTARLAAIPRYVQLFDSAFSEPPTAAGVAKALAQFQRTLVSAYTPYDLYRRNEFPNILTTIEIRGLQLVRQKCGNCHAGELFTDNRYHNNGIDDVFTDESHEEVYLGRYRVTRNIAEIGAFKTPSLRNVMLSAPYMHDGRFASIDEVLNHYRFGVKRSPYTAKNLYSADGQTGIPMSDQETADIKAFLHSLTDQQLLKNKLFNNPHKL